MSSWYKRRAQQLTPMRQWLLRPVIFVCLAMGLLVLAELLAMARLTWLNHQRIHTIETDVGKGHQLEDNLFELMQLQAHQSLQKIQDPAIREQINALERDLAALLGDTHEADLKMLQESLAKAVAGDQQSLIDSLTWVRQVLKKQTEEEEQLLIGVETDSQLELQMAVILPLLLFAIGYYFFRNNVLEPLDSLKELLSGLVEGVKQPITRPTSDPTLYALFEHYNRLVEHLVELEAEHLNYTATLEKQVRETSHALLEQSQRLAKSERLAALTEMAASTAHELRNPLAIIQISLENILHDTEDPDLSERVRLLHREVQRLTDHLNALLSTTRGQAESVRRIDIGHALQDLIGLLNYQVDQRVTLRCTAEPGLFASLPETQFRQVLLNLLQNAIQAIGAEHGTVTIAATASRQQLQIVVGDSGSGFDDAFLQKGIRPFVSMKANGTGLGLAMVQRFAHDHQGQLKLENDAQGHAKVTLFLPLLNA